MEIDIDIEDIIISMRNSDKRRLYRELMKDPVVVSEKERLEQAADERRQQEFMLMDRLEAMSRYELKQTLCNLLGVPSYTDEQALRAALEKIITA